MKEMKLFRTAFGDPRPTNFEEMKEALEEREADPSECNAEIRHEPVDDGQGNSGWTAEVRYNEDGEGVFDTLAYESKDKLTKDLKAAGIEDIEIMK